MSALMTSMRVKQLIKLSKLVENKTCTLCSKPLIAEKVSGVQGFSSQPSGTSTGNRTETGGEDEKDDEKKPNWFKKNGMKLAAVGVIASCVAGVYSSGAPDTDAEGQIVKDEYSDYVFPASYMMRCYKRVNQEVKVTKEPSREKLLPDPLTYPYLQPKYTIVIEMTDVLVHPQWNAIQDTMLIFGMIVDLNDTHLLVPRSRSSIKFQTGWRFKKRPGIDVFLRAIGPPLFEVVIYTRESGMTADPIITKVDPENFIMYRLYRDSTRYENGVHIKDLRFLNRDLSKVIMIDWDKKAVQLTPENGFYLKKWTGENNDTALGELAEFLRAIAVSNVDDVRPVLQYYSQFDEPLAKFHENQIKLKTMRTIAGPLPESTLQEEQDRQARVIKQQTDKSLSGLSSLWRKR